jgi:N-methylhydantoinase B/oxoprolinase/acetone carboxylase alpha subunit
MFRAIRRLAFGFAIREADDASSVITTPSGDAVGVSRQSVPVLVGAVPSAIRDIFANHYSPENLEPGDVIITNDPWIGGGHLLDIVVITPIFYEGELVGLAGSLGNVDDIGGLAGAWVTEGSQVYEEGLIIPPTKLYEGGDKNEAVEEFIRSNVRLADQAMGDIEAMRSANNLGATELREMVDEYGVDTYMEATKGIIDKSEQALRSEIDDIEDGTYESEYVYSVADILEDYDELKIDLSVTIDGSDIHVDFTGTSEQIPAGVNCPYTNIVAVVQYIIRCMTVSDLDGSEGFYKPIEITAPEGTLVNPTRPVATDSRHLVYFPAEFALVKALGQAMPDKLVSDFSGGLQILNVSGTTDQGQEFIGVGLGCKPSIAHAHRDANPGVTHFPSNAKLVSVEMMEQYNPILFESTNKVPDTEGAGKYRSEFSPEWVVRNHMAESNVNLLVTSAAGARRPEGVKGGHDGIKAEAELLDSDTELSTSGRGVLPPGQRVRLLRSSPGGYGDPTERDPEKIERDMEIGLLSEERAREVYDYEG